MCEAFFFIHIRFVVFLKAYSFPPKLQYYLKVASEFTISIYFVYFTLNKFKNMISQHIDINTLLFSQQELQ